MAKGGDFFSIKIENLAVKRGSDRILHDVSFDMDCGEITAIAGAPGGGKTTLLRALLNEVRHRGKIRIQYADDDKMHKIKRTNRINMGFVPQRLEFDINTPISVMDFLLACRNRLPVFAGRHKKEVRRVLANLSASGCHDVENKLLGELGGGEIRRILLANALTPMPDLLVLDEPLLGIEKADAETFYKLISDLRERYPMAIAVVSNEVDLIRRYADKAVLINKTVLACGAPDEVLNSSLLISNL